MNRSVASLTPLVVALFALLTLFTSAAPAQGFKEAPNPDFGSVAEREREYDLLHTVIDVTLDVEARTIDGTVTHRVTTFGPRSELSFDAEDLAIRYASVDGAKVPFRQDGRHLRLTLPKALVPGVEATVEIGYRGSPSVGLYWVGPEAGYPDKPYQCWTQGQDEDNHYWVPIYDDPNDKATWETLLTVREDLTAVSNGELVATRSTRPGWRTFHHHMREPNSTYLIAFAVGPWERYVDTWRGRPVEYFVSKGVGEETARRSFGETPRILEVFSERFGVEYPWSKYAQVAVAEFVVGGMENVTCTLQTDRTLHDATAALERSSIGLVAHEAAHQWFGDLVTCRTWADLWLNEGFATYGEALYHEAVSGRDEMRLDMWENQRRFMRSDGDTPRPMVVDFFSRSGGRTSHHVYTKGSSVLHMLRFVLGDDAFFASVKHFLEKHRLGSVDTHDFQIAIAETTGRNLEWFFEQWVRLAGYPKFTVTFEYDERAQQGTMKVTQTQETGGLVPLFRTPVDVEFVVRGEPSVRRILVTEREQVFSFALDGRPSRVRFDKGGWITKELTFERPLAELIETAEEDDDVVGRIEAVRALKERKDPLAPDALARVMLSDDHHRVRVEAAAGLEEQLGVEGGEARRSLLAALDDGEARVRKRAVQALGKAGADEEVHRRLVQVLATDDAYGPRAAAVEALAEGKAERAFDVAELALLIPSHQAEIGRAALNAMITADAARAAPYVVTAADYGGLIDLRHEALRRFSRIVDHLEGSEHDRAVAVARRGLGDLWSRTRRSAISALQALGAKDALDELDLLAKDDPNRRLRDSAKRAAEEIRKGKREDPSDVLRRQVERLERRLEEIERKEASGARAPAGR